MNVAPTLRAEFIVIVQVVPLHDDPLHSSNVELLPGVSVIVTTIPAVKFAVHPTLDPVLQLIPAGLLVSVPVPVPEIVAVNAYVGRLNVAVTDFAALIVTTHVPVPVHAPLHPANVLGGFALPPLGVAVNVTTVPAL